VSWAKAKLSESEEGSSADSAEGSGAQQRGGAGGGEEESRGAARTTTPRRAATTRSRATPEACAAPEVRLRIADSDDRVLKPTRRRESPRPRVPECIGEGPEPAGGVAGPLKRLLVSGLICKILFFL